MARVPIPRQQRMRPGAPAVLALGSNLGDRAATLTAAIADLEAAPGVRVNAVSSFIETVAVKPAGVDATAPAYLNAVALIATTLDPYALLALTSAVEHAHGRVREEVWGDRTLDIDIIDFAGRVNDDPRLTLPHPRAWERVFVLQPWFELAPDAELPGFGRIDKLLAAASENLTELPDSAEGDQ